MYVSFSIKTPYQFKVSYKNILQEVENFKYLFWW